MADKLEGTAIIANTVSGDRIVTGSITTAQLAPSVATFVNEGKPLKIRTITYPGNDTAANTGGGQTIVLSGSGFKQNVQVYINSNAVPSVTYANANAISFTSPALAAATYPVYVINTDDGATAILIPGIQYSGTPTWTTTTPLTTQDASIAWSIQLVATSDSTVSYSLQAGSSLPAGITLAANGLISGTMTSPPTDETTYNFTVVANDLEQQDASRAFSVSVTVAALDPYFTYTTLLLHGDGTNNANNHAFVDSSNNAFTITRNGNASQGTFSPFGDNWSNFFDGTDDYVNVPANSSLLASTGDYTIEGWINPSNTASGIIIGSYPSGTNGNWIIRFNSNKLSLYQFPSVNDTLISVSNIQVSQWTHFAVSRSSGTTRLFINGILESSIATSYTLGIAGNAINIGRYEQSGTYYSGYMSNIRYIVGTALYTANFTPPTQPYTSIANTSLLTCQSNAFIDKSPYRHAVSGVNGARVSKFDPFKPYKAIPASYGVYFDGASDYLDFPANTACAFGTGDFTVECWMRTSTTSADSFYRRVFMVDGPTGNAGGNFQITLTPSSGYILLWDSVLSLSGAINVCDGNWHHIAATRSGTTLRLFVDGVLDTSGTYSTSVSPNSGSPRPRIGSYDGSGGDFEGYISNLRVLKGTALYTTTFTPPTTALTAVANTQLLTCQSTTIIDNSTNAFTITRNGDARPTDLNPFTTTFVSEKYNTANGGGAVYSDGSGDYLSIPGNAALRPGTGDFTIELWWYPTNNAGGQYLVHQNFGNANSGYANFLIYGHTSNSLLYYSSTTGSSWNVFSGLTIGTYVLNAWNHIVISRTSGTLRTFLNGVLGSSSADTSNLNDTGNVYSGTYNGSAGFFYGYVSGFRMRVGTLAGITQIPIQDTPPTNVANTSLLCNFTNAGILDSVGKNVLETVGDARVNTSVKKYGTGSMYFDGSGDYLRSPYNPDLQMKAGDFTVECWVYMPSAPADYGLIFNTRNSNTQYSPFQVYIRSTRVVEVYLSTNGSTFAATITTSMTVPLTTWTHIAVVRLNGVVKIYINGVADGASATVAGSLYEDTSWGNNIGAETTTTGIGNAFIGNIDDLRITRGVARYRYNFTPPTKAFNDGDGNLANNTTDVLVGDQVNLPVFPYTTLLLHGDGTNNANNHAFVDSSNNAFAITRNGNATQGTFSPFSPTGWSAYFDGSGDYVSFGDVLDIGSSNFTFECFVNFSSFASGSYNAIFTKYGADYQYQLLWDAANSRWFWNINSTVSGNSTVYYNDSLRVGEWYHLAFIKNGTSYSLYRNGVLIGTQTISGDIAGGTRPFTLGMTFGGSNNALYPFHGYISNFRALVGTILYTSNFTPPTTPLTAIANTQLLTVQSNRFVDNSTNAYSPTITGDTSIQAFSPFPPSVEYTANTHGGSAYFDGTGDYLTLADNAAFTVGSDDFTVDFWIYNNTTGARRFIYGQSNSGGQNVNIPFSIYKNASNKLQFDVFASGSGTQYSATSSTDLPLNQWVHVACVRNGGTTRIYINGVQDGTNATISTTTLVDSSNLLGIGCLGEYTSDLWLGYISNLRFIKGTCLYPSGTTFTPSTSPVTAVANTQLLCNFTNAGILDSTGRTVLETVGDAKVNTAIKKYGTGSMAFDGSGDDLRVLNAGVTTGFRTGDFTVEFWVYANSWSAFNNLIDFRKVNDYFMIAYTSSALQYYNNASYRINAGSLSTATWHHVAVCRYNSVTKMFVNGIQLGGDYADTSDYPVESVITIGARNDDVGNPFNGYIDDVRITKGIARYIRNFTPPTAAFLNK